MHVYLGFTRSNNMLNLNTESLLQIFCGIKKTHNFQSHEANKNRSKHTTPDIPGEILLLKTPISYILYSTRNHETTTYKTIITRALSTIYNRFTLSYNN